MNIEILWPVFAMVALIHLVWLVMYIQRFRLMKANPPTAESFASSEAAMRYFAPVEMPANNFRNLFEMPVLFFALAPLLVLTELATPPQIVLAWAYVGLRAVHSYVQVSVGHVPTRFFVYLASCAVLAAMWIGFGVDLAVTG